MGDTSTGEPTDALAELMAAMLTRLSADERAKLAELLKGESDG